jgi:hypothetical protein
MDEAPLGSLWFNILFLFYSRYSFPRWFLVLSASSASWRLDGWLVGYGNIYQRYTVHLSIEAIPKGAGRRKVQGMCFPRFDGVR